MTKFQSTLSMRRATPGEHVVSVVGGISIHALHEESDRCGRHHSGLRGISIHALHEESDLPSVPMTHHCDEFQSTLSMRRATKEPSVSNSLDRISIHALHEESDKPASAWRVPSGFQSTLSMRRATVELAEAWFEVVISIHALHEESDHFAKISHYSLLYFNPRSP